MARWDRPGIPHKGWEYIGMEDLGEECCPGEEIPYEQCDMCGNEKIRYVHIMKHPDIKGEFRVGCDCASNMAENYMDPERNERDLRNRSNRRKNFMKQEWCHNIEKDSYTLRYKGENITIVKSKYGTWGVVFHAEWRWEYNGRKMRDLHIAKLVAFDLFDELHETSSSMQPYWDGTRWIYA